MHDLPESAAVVIIGGGFAGAATAYQLARAGCADVVLVEREVTCGYHASGRNAALGRQLTEDDAVTELTVRGAAFLRRPPEGFAEHALLSTSGSILLVDRANERASLLDRAAAWDLPAEPLERAAVVARWPHLADAAHAGGVFFPTDGVIDVHALLQGYLGAARRRGVRVVTRCEVQAFEPAPNGARVVTSRGTVEARVVVNAAGAWVSQLAGLAGAAPGRFDPIQRHLMVTEPVAALDRGAPFVWHIGDGEFYVRPEGAGFLLSACDETVVPPCDARPDHDLLAELAAKLGRVAPSLADLGIARSWACLRTFAPDRRPVVAWDAALPWLFWVAGLGGHGATASAAIGERAAAAILPRVAPRLA